MYHICAIIPWSACLGQWMGGMRRELGGKELGGSKDVHLKYTDLVGVIEGPDSDTPEKVSPCCQL